MTKNLYTQFGFKDEQDYIDNLYPGAYKIILASVAGKKADRAELTKTIKSIMKKDVRVNTLAVVLMAKWFEESYGKMSAKNKKGGFLDGIFKGGKK